jgi:multisubunit Na+/H+ antiporter MnhE subunit
MTGGRAQRLGRLITWTVGWAWAAATYLLLIDQVRLAELLAGVAVTLVAAVGSELARRQQVPGFALRPGLLVGIPRALMRAPADVIIVSAAVVRQLVRPRTSVGEFRATAFRCGADPRLESSRRALAESFGSFAPNTIVIGVDPDREVLLCHQLRHQGGRETLDPLRLG